MNCSDVILEAINYSEYRLGQARVYKMAIFLTKTVTIYPTLTVQITREDVAFSEAILFRNKEVD